MLRRKQGEKGHGVRRNEAIRNDVSTIAEMEKKENLVSLCTGLVVAGKR